MEVVRTLADVVAAVAFASAAILTALTPPADEGKPTPASKWLITVSFGVFALVMGSKTVSDLGVPSPAAPLESFAEALVPLLALGILFARRASQQYAELAREQRALGQTHDLMEAIVDSAPAGIMFLDAGGGIAFANDTAKELLELQEDDACVHPVSPGWRVRGVNGAGSDDLSPLVAAEPYDQVVYTLERPDGATMHLRVSGRPLSDSEHAVGGVVVAFERA